jgi:putative DNA primase/helicase
MTNNNIRPRCFATAITNVAKVSDARERLEPETASDKYAAIRGCLQLYHSAAAGIDGVFVLTIIDHTGKALVQQFAVGDVDAMAAEALARGQNANVYLAPALLRKDLSRGKRGALGDIVIVLSFVVDDDGDKRRNAVLPPGIDPSIVVTTSRIPCVNRQFHFILKRPLPPAEAKALAELLHRKCGGDNGTKDVVHVWRLPQTLNHPNAAKISRGRPAEPQAVELTGGTFQPVDPDELQRALESMPDLKPQTRTANGADARSFGHGRQSTDPNTILARLPAWLRQLLEQQTGKQGDRSSHCHHVMQALMEHGLSDNELAQVADDAPFAAKYTERGDLDAEIAREREWWHANGRKLRSSAHVGEENGHADSNSNAISAILTQDWLARAFVVENRQRIRFDHYRGRWYIFNSARGIWECDETGAILDEIRRFCAAHDNPLKPKLGRANTIFGIEQLARVDIEIAVTSSEWDDHPYLLGTPGAYIDLRTGVQHPPNADRMVTQSTIAAVEVGEPEHWLRFLNEATGHDAEYVDYIQRALGYCLTGDVKEQILFFVHGPGGTGKSTLVNIIQEILGTYAWAAPMAMFAARTFEAHPTEVASLRGRRFVTATETQQGRAWDEPRIKQLTGGDMITARFMRRDFFQFKPTHKLVIIGNHAPTIQSSGEDMRRRFHVWPFEHQPHERDKDLPAKLVLEAGRILGWMIRGALQWQQRGLDPPPVVRAATEAYFETQDIFTEWLEACTRLSPNFRDTATNLYRSYAASMKNLSEPVLSSKAFGDELRRRGFKRTKYVVDGRQWRGWAGLKVFK